MDKMNIPELINNVYNRTDGDILYEKICEYFSEEYFEQDDIVYFVDRLLVQCLPSARIAGIGPWSLADFASSIVRKTKLLNVFHSQDVVTFIHKLLLRQAQEK